MIIANTHLLIFHAARVISIKQTGVLSDNLFKKKKKRYKNKVG